MSLKGLFYCIYSHKKECQLRYFKSWLTIGWILVFLVCYFSLTSTPPKIDIKFEHLDKLEHMLSYLVLMTWFAQLYQTEQSRIYYALLFIVMGIMLEVLQGLGGIRFFEYMDMLANTTGVILGYLLTKGKLKDLLLSFESRL